MLIELCTGWIAGGIHALSGPDHLAAVVPLAIRRPQAATHAGLRWGLGHALGVGLLATLALWLRTIVAIELWSAWAERLVGVALVGVGLFALRSALRSRLHTHIHEHSGTRHAHVHVHATDQAHAPRSGGDAVHEHRHVAFGIGALHGIAGTAHLVAILPALALPSAAQTSAYLLGYGTGATLAMGLFGAGVGRMSRGRELEGTLAYRTLLSSAGVAAIAIGAVWIAS